MKKSIPMSVADPTTGLYSRTHAEQSTNLANVVTDSLQSIIQGQQPLSSWAGTVRSWRSSGGDQMRSEYEEALAKSK
jgi:putative aldouronate transport system substrate-binding protein